MKEVFYTTGLPSLLCVVFILWLVVSSAKVDQGRLFKIFLAYAVTILLFAFVYYGVYTHEVNGFVADVEDLLSRQAHGDALSAETLSDDLERMIDDLPFNFSRRYDTFRKHVPDMAALVVSGVRSAGGGVAGEERHVAAIRPLLVWIERLNSGPEVFFDMLYFSAMTITTIGYGDILPNSTLVRGLVVAEILAGILLLVFFVNSTSSEYLRRNGRR